MWVGERDEWPEFDHHQAQGRQLSPSRPTKMDRTHKTPSRQVGLYFD